LSIQGSRLAASGWPKCSLGRELDRIESVTARSMSRIAEAGFFSRSRA